MMQHNNKANTHRSLHALAIISHQHKMGGGCPLIRVRSLIRSNTVVVSWQLHIQGVVIRRSERHSRPYKSSLGAVFCPVLDVIDTLVFDNCDDCFAFSHQEAIVVVLDVGPSMSQSAHGELSALQESLDCIGKFLSRKVSLVVLARDPPMDLTN